MIYYVVMYIERQRDGENTESLSFALIHSTFHSHFSCYTKYFIQGHNF